MLREGDEGVRFKKEKGFGIKGLPATRRLNMFWPLDDSACSSAAERVSTLSSVDVLVVGM
jgi:hypothetical protein